MSQITSSFDSVVVDGIKLKSLPYSEFKLAPVTVLTGDHDSGKSAVLEGVGLALTGACSAGSKSNLISLQLPGDSARASLYLSGYEDGVAKDLGLHWAAQKRWKNGKQVCSTSNSVVGGEPDWPERLLAGLPVTGEELWSWTGEQKWAALERIGGKFETPQPPACDHLKEELKRLENSQPPEQYTGRSLSEIKEELTDLEKLIREQQSARKHAEYRKTKLEHTRAELDRQNKTLSDATEACRMAEERSAQLQWVASNAGELLEQWRSSPEYALAGMGNTVSAVCGYIHDWNKQRCESLIDLLDTMDDQQWALQMKHTLDELEVKVYDLMTTAMQNQDVTIRPKQMDAIEKLLADNDLDIPISNPEQVHVAIQSAVEHASLDHQRHWNQCTACRNEIAKLQMALDNESDDLGNILSQEEFAEKLQRKSDIANEWDKAKSWEEWQRGANQRVERMKELAAEIADSEEKTTQWRRARSNHIQGLIEQVSEKANLVIEDLGIPPLELDVSTTGKRQSLDLTAAGVDRRAMSGSRELIYSVALLHALQMLSDSQSPMMLVEASELNAERLSHLCLTFARHREKGNVMLAHWAHPGDINVCSDCCVYEMRAPEQNALQEPAIGRRAVGA